jgi:conjugative element/phage-associated large polyvalent protein
MENKMPTTKQKPANPVYKQAATAWAKNPSRSVYISTTDTAKLIRAQLKTKFPSCKFSVRSDKYSGGSSIRIHWTDGPTAKMVDAVVKSFAGGGFDGMIDMNYHKDAWLYRDGSSSHMHTGGTEGSMGTVPSSDLTPKADGAIPVSFSADYVFTERSISRAAMERALKSYAKRHHDDLAQAIRAKLVRVEDSKWGDYQISSCAHQYRGQGEGSQYGGDTVLSAYAQRRMMA